MTDEELLEKTRRFNTLLHAYGKQAMVFSRLNAAMLEDSRIEMKQLLEEIEIEITRRRYEAQEPAQTEL
jgi:hypothetical protein